MIADTDFLISLIDRDPNAHAKLRELEDDGVPVKIPAMALLELFIGVGAAMTDEEERTIRGIIQSHRIVPMDEEIAMRAGRRIGAIDASRMKKNKGDAAIGATADVEGEPVLTRNVDDFEALGFEVESY